MCVVSMVGDHYGNKFNQPDWLDHLARVQQAPRTVSVSEFDELKKEVLEMKELLKKAIEYDKRTNQPHCEDADKKALLIKIADVFGVNLKEIFEDELE